MHNEFGNVMENQLKPFHLVFVMEWIESAAK